MSRGRNAHEQCVTHCPVSRLVHSPGRPASVITWKISTRHAGKKYWDPSQPEWLGCYIIVKLIFVTFN